MVKVITIMDEVYAELYALKMKKGMSFTKAIRYLLDTETPKENRSLMEFAGSIESENLDSRMMAKSRKIFDWKGF